MPSIRYINIYSLIIYVRKKRKRPQERTLWYSIEKPFLIDDTFDTSVVTILKIDLKRFIVILFLQTTVANNEIYFLQPNIYNLDIICLTFCFNIGNQKRILTGPQVIISKRNLGNCQAYTKYQIHNPRARKMII